MRANCSGELNHSPLFFGLIHKTFSGRHRQILHYRSWLKKIAACGAKRAASGIFIKPYILI